MQRNYKYINFFLKADEFKGVLKIIEKENCDDIIFITHDHCDHFSQGDIKKIKKLNVTLLLYQLAEHTQ